jgi:hypothetical protein
MGRRTTSLEGLYSTVPRNTTTTTTRRWNPRRNPHRTAARPDAAPAPASQARGSGRTWTTGPPAHRPRTSPGGREALAEGARERERAGLMRSAHGHTGRESRARGDAGGGLGLRFGFGEARGQWGSGREIPRPMILTVSDRQRLSDLCDASPSDMQCESCCQNV